MTGYFRKHFFSPLADCCSTVELTRIGSSVQAGLYGTYEKTLPLQTTTFNGVIYPAYEMGTDFLHRVTGNSFSPWVLGPTVGAYFGGIFFANSPQCPNVLSFAVEYDGSGFVALESNEWSISCSGGK